MSKYILFDLWTDGRVIIIIVIGFVSTLEEQEDKSFAFVSLTVRSGSFIFNDDFAMQADRRAPPRSPPPPERPRPTRISSPAAEVA